MLITLLLVLVLLQQQILNASLFWGFVGFFVVVVFFIEFLSLNYSACCEMLLLQFAFRKVTVQTLDKARPLQGPVQPVPCECTALSLLASS